MAARILVTGGAGFIGSNLALTLQEKGNEVVLLDDFSSGHFENLRGFRGDVVSADISHAQGWVYRVGPLESIFHQAAVTDTTRTDQRRMMEVNVEGFRNVLDFAAGAGVKRVIYASSAGVYGSGAGPMREPQEPSPANVYAFSKQVMEKVAEDFVQETPDIKVTGLRYFNVYGPRESFKGSAASMIWQLSRQMLSGKRPRIFKHGEQYRDFIYIRDVVDANLKALEAGTCGVFNVCTGKKATFNKIIEVLNEELGTDFSADYFDNPYAFYQNETLGDPEAAERALGFKAKYTIEQGIREYMEAVGSVGKGRKERHAIASRNPS